MILIDIEMPENCTECPCLNDEYFHCQIGWRSCKDDNVIKHRPDWCPLQELPQHGDLIDRDKLMPIEIMKGMEDTKAVWWSDIESAPTVIQANNAL